MKYKRQLILLTMLCATLTSAAQNLLSDTHRIDSIMQRMERCYGKVKPWRYRRTMADSVTSIVIRKRSMSGRFNPDILKSSAPMLVNHESSSPFSWRDNMMWARDYNWSHFASDLLFGR